MKTLLVHNYDRKSTYFEEIFSISWCFYLDKRFFWVFLLIFFNIRLHHYQLCTSSSPTISSVKPIQQEHAIQSKMWLKSVVAKALAHPRCLHLTIWLVWNSSIQNCMLDTKPDRRAFLKSNRYYARLWRPPFQYSKMRMAAYDHSLSSIKDPQLLDTLRLIICYLNCHENGLGKLYTLMNFLKGTATFPCTCF